MVVDFSGVVGVGGDGGAHRSGGRRPVACLELGNLKRSGGSMHGGASAGGLGVWTEVDLFVEFEWRGHGRGDRALGRNLSNQHAQSSVENSETQVDGERDGENQSQVDQQRSGGLRGMQVEVGGSAGVGFKCLHKVLGLLVFFRHSDHGSVELGGGSTVQKAVVSNNMRVGSRVAHCVIEKLSEKRSRLVC